MHHIHVHTVMWKIIYFKHRVLILISILTNLININFFVYFLQNVLQTMLATEHRLRAMEVGQSTAYYYTLVYSKH